MGDELKQIKEELDRELQNVSRQAAHSMMDLDAALSVLSAEMNRRLVLLEARVSKLEARAG